MRRCFGGAAKGCETVKRFRITRGFTLAELLIVIAIIAALVAIMIPTFGGQVEKAREAADIANVRAACSEVAVSYVEGKDDLVRRVPVTQTKANWQTANGATEREEYIIAGDAITVKYKTADKDEFYTVTCDEKSGKITVG
jgi:prepilin-type N-terminal cleavage/methylation domain-containing protein